MADITGSIRDYRGVLIPNVPVVLTGEGIEPRTSITGIDGRFQFTDLIAGTYRINSIHDNYYANEVVVIGVGQAINVVVELKLSRADFINTKCECFSENKYVPLKYAQYLFLGFVGWLFFKGLIVDRIPDLSLSKLNDPEIGRGVITYLVAMTTISMAAILMLSAIMTGGKDMDKRFALGKEILTLLIGILGTIIGFYYGSSGKPTVVSGNTPIKIDSFQVKKKQREVILSGKVTGSKSPPTYSVVSVPKASLNVIKSKAIINGDIQDTLTLPESVNANFIIGLVVSGDDASDVSFNKELKLLIVK